MTKYRVDHTVKVVHLLLLTTLNSNLYKDTGSLINSIEWDEISGKIDVKSESIS